MRAVVINNLQGMNQERMERTWTNGIEKAFDSSVDTIKVEKDTFKRLLYYAVSCWDSKYVSTSVRIRERAGRDRMRNDQNGHFGGDSDWKPDVPADVSGFRIRACPFGFFTSKFPSTNNPFINDSTSFFGTQVRDFLVGNPSFIVPFVLTTGLNAYTRKQRVVSVKLTNH